MMSPMGDDRLNCYTVNVVNSDIGRGMDPLFSKPIKMFSFAELPSHWALSLVWMAEEQIFLEMNQQSSIGKLCLCSQCNFFFFLAKFLIISDQSPGFFFAVELPASNKSSIHAGFQF